MGTGICFFGLGKRDILHWDCDLITRGMGWVILKMEMEFLFFSGLRTVLTSVDT